MGSTFATSYPDLMVVGIRTRSWNSFANDQGETVPAGAKHYLQVVKQSDTLGTVGEVLIDGETALELEHLGFGTTVTIQGAPYKEGRQEMIRAESIQITSPAAN